ncbi:MAG: dihydroorotase [Cyclobacteriaceae bacterium]|nr:MAG: dihydroorotase [Cyclobacteriaceae bacterium]
MTSILITNGNLVNEGRIYLADVLIKGDRIYKIGQNLNHPGAMVVDARGQYLLPGVIDDQVHFREPGLTHKGSIATESRAAVAGGITSFMEMPNTKPPTLTQALLEDKYDIAAKDSMANYSFYMGASNDNLQDVLQTDPGTVCGIKVFMGSSTGNMLVDDDEALEALFSKAHIPIATHCEDEETIKHNLEKHLEKYGENIPFRCHPEIRSTQACYLSSSKAVNLARKYRTRLHILHISTGKETQLFESGKSLNDKHITSEACIHHLWFSDQDYQSKGSAIKWNPAIKTADDRSAIWQALLDGRIDVIATDHAPHTIEEKEGTYLNAPSGGPLIQHSLVAMMEFYHQGKISMEMIVKKMCHNPAQIFQVMQRGYLREGYFADLVLVDPNNPWTVSTKNILAKCKWSPFNQVSFKSQVTHTFVSGTLVYQNGVFDESVRGQRLTFDR